MKTILLIKPEPAQAVRDWKEYPVKTYSFADDDFLYGRNWLKRFLGTAGRKENQKAFCLQRRKLLRRLAWH